MQSQTSDNSGLNKLKEILFLILSCNHTTLIGCALTWVYIQNNQLIDYWFDSLIFVLCLIPMFMGDAVNNYVLGRIRLEAVHNWDDIRMETKVKDGIAKYYKVYRGISILASYGLASLNLFVLSHKPVPQWLKITIITTAVIHFIRCAITIHTGIASIIPYYKKNGLLHRMFIMLAISGLWFWLFSNQTFNRINLLFIFVSSLFYFVACGLMHPLPLNGSFIGSILKDIIISSNPKSESNPEIDYNQKREDIEDASIIENSENNVSRETETNPKTNSQEVQSIDAVTPDVIILTEETTNERL